jgi:DNA polymerase-3 subunit delta'
MASVDGVPLPAALACLSQQPRVQEFLGDAVREGRVSHAYLFVGAPGSGMDEAARALAQCIVCPNGGDGTCDECIRVSHGTHPDVHVYEPGSVTGYLVSQVRELIVDVSLAPVRAPGKVYVIREAALLRGAAANALLKTIEEPPEGVYFILIARTAAALLPTIVSRCQQVPFRIVSPDAAQRAVEAKSGIGGTDARVALSVAGTPDRAAEFLASSGRREVRRLVVQTLGELANDDSWDVLVAARQIVEAVKAPLADVRSAQEAALGQDGDYLPAKALKQLEDANRRELTARERSGMMEALSAAESLLRDVLLRCEGIPEGIVNEDAADVVDRLASSTPTEGVVRALEAVRSAADDLAHNVTPQLAIEAMLLSVKEALACPPSYR